MFAYTMIEEGTRVILVDGEGHKSFLRASNGMVEVGKLGVVDGRKICDASFGDRLSIGGTEFTILKPSVLDIVGAVQRKAQIMNPKDSFLVPMYLDLESGSRVIEAGAGSGALTVVLLKAVAPTGKVYSYDNREDHAKQARRNVEMSGHADCWELKIGDICTVEPEKDVDAAVLDMPNPWDAVANLHRAIRPGGYLCCYVPNANQLDRTVRAMRDAGMRETYAFETIQREMVVHEGGVRPSFEMLGHTGYMAIARKI